jgi:hypothetical protein
VKPVPILQIINLLFGISALAFEWPIKPLSSLKLHSSIEFRLMMLPLLALAAVVMYQSTNAALYYLVAEAVYFCAFYDGEVSLVITFT